jgi:LmbE family N-acetylglucosaminyl deacetylase
MKLFAPLALAAVLTASASAQTTFTDPANLRGERVAPRDGRELLIDKSEALGGRGLEQLLRKLNTRASLMLIVAHPDDEDGGMLTFYSRGMGARVGMLTLNRGEGGQNLMTGDFEDALGLLRTQELLAADRYFGADQFFGTEVDFGFSKTKEEAFAKWTHERVLYDAVRAVRLYRPLVIASVFIGGVTDGHGQHQVAGEIAQEVFKAAGDPNVFPELAREGILPWQPLKVYARVPMGAITPQGLFDYATGRFEPAKFTNYVTGEVTTTTPSVDVTVHEGKIDPILGPHRAVEDFVSYVQFARQGLGLQKSQIGTGTRVPPAGVFDVSYHRYGSKLPPSRQKVTEDSFFDGIDTSLAGIAELAPAAFPELHASLAKIQADINVATDHLDPTNLEKVAPMLADALKQCDSLLKEVEAARLPNEAKQNVLHELRIKRVQLNDALVLALGLGFDATAIEANQPIKTPVLVHMALTTDSLTPVPYFSEEIRTANGKMQRGPSSDDEPAITKARPKIDDLKATEELSRQETRPYFFRTDIEQPVYQLHEPNLRNAPATPPAITSWAHLFFNGAEVELGRVVHAGAQPVEFVPPGSILLSAHAQVIPNDSSAILFSIFVQPIGTPASSRKFEVLPGWKTHIAIEDYLRPDEVVFQLDAPATNRKAFTLKASVTLPAQQPVSEGVQAIGYTGIPFTNYYTPANDRIVPVDLKLPAKHNIAYLPGTGDAVPEALASIGVKPTTLTIADLTAAKLAQYDTVILGVRTYAAHADLHGAPTQALLDYAKNGGNVVVQYQTGEFTAADAPFPIAVGNAAERVIDETDPVQLLVPDSPLLTTPNKIIPADFNNWIEERGHGFLRTWDDRYTALTETHDPGDPPQRGGLVTTQLGKGRWTYCAYALYRQLPEALPGAFRLFVNLINP